MSKAIVNFSIQYKDTKWGDAIYISGSIPELGEWDADKAVRMNGFNGNWIAYVTIPINTTFEYKYFYRSGNYLKWDHENHTRLINIPVGEVCEIRDLWSEPPTANEKLRRTAIIKNVCQVRENPQQLPALTTPEDGKVTVVFEVPVPLLGPKENVHLIGATKHAKFWRINQSQSMYDGDYPIFRCAKTFTKNELPVQYKFVLSHSLGEKCEDIEVGGNHMGSAPIPIAQYDQDCIVWVLREGRPFPIQMQDAIKEKHMNPLKHDYAQYLFIRSEEFHYPNKPNMKLGGLVIPVFSLRTKQSLGIGEFADLPTMADFCYRSGLRVIQLLPITDTTVNFVNWRDSYPYSATSSFALHPIYVNIDSIGNLPPEIASSLPKLREELNLPKVDYEKTLTTKLDLLQKVFDYHRSKKILEADTEFPKFLQDSRYWLPSYAAFKTLAEKHKTTTWESWPETDKKEENVQKLVSDMMAPTHPLYSRVLFHQWVQYHLDKQLRTASQTCAKKYHVALKGDIPIGVDLRSADTWYFRPYFRFGTKSGAPPDDFSVHGQNWEFPTYNWDKMIEDNFDWFRNRLIVMARSSSLYRIDHILGFFRIWEIPGTCEGGLHARFFPGEMIHKNDLKSWGGLEDYFGRLTTPIITYDLVNREFGDKAMEVIQHFMQKAPADFDGELLFRPEYQTETAIANEVKKMWGITPTSDSDTLKELDTYLKHFWILTNSVCLFKYDDWYVPRFGMKKSLSWQMLGPEWQRILETMEREYFWKWHSSTWWNSAEAKFPRIKAATDMLVCGEDLGLLRDLVPEMMHKYEILGLRVQRMTPDPHKWFYHPNEYSHDIVATTSTHDMPPLRAWWKMVDRSKVDFNQWVHTAEGQEACDKRNCFWYNVLENHWETPDDLSNYDVNRIVDMHVYSPAMFCILPYQDLVAILPDQDVYHQNPFDEVINDPSNRTHYWQYRMPCFVEKLLEKQELIDTIREKMELSGRLADH
ncbi:putative 4-alpha-glucanotransferase DPE2 [Blattamonas nauphoetae]|uniref:4-alpha-glucanotransferase n=1 Tax=Blattamonas nauphoetae TaxID=2049346 RepID=A0ABQ9Y036_9EUKA|nr:putative 4-alpha-glucanotransferase DPE2 [Blattamonas nauphoetae]